MAARAVLARQLNQLQPQPHPQVQQTQRQLSPFQRFQEPFKMSVGFIGAGRMAFAMIRGFINQKMVAPQQIIASDIDVRSVVQ